LGPVPQADLMSNVAVNIPKYPVAKPNVAAANNVTFTAGMFAQTKFGSTKLKTNSKRSNRMSPTEFSNYIKQRAVMQQQQHQLQLLNGNSCPVSQSQTMAQGHNQAHIYKEAYCNQPSPQLSGMRPQRPRSLSPNPQLDLLQYAINQQQNQELGSISPVNTSYGLVNHKQQQQQHQQLHQQQRMYQQIQQQQPKTGSSAVPPPFSLQQFDMGGSFFNNNNNNSNNSNNNNRLGKPLASPGGAENALVDGFGNFNLNGLSYSSQQLLMAN